MATVEDELFLLMAVVAKRRRKRRIGIQRLHWIHPYWENNRQSSLFKVSEALKFHEDKFFKLYRMTKSTFQILCSKMESYCVVNTKLRSAVSVEERLLIFLRYLSTGLTFTELAFEFYRGVSTVSEVIEHVAQTLWDLLHEDYMSIPTTDEWVDISDRFYELWNIPNCIGCVDGKHIRLKNPQHSGSAYFNYHGFFSIVLLACVDADCLFTWISVGDYGRNSDGRVIKSCGFLNSVETNQLGIPPAKPLPNTTAPPFPYFFIGDQGFPLRPYLMRPYPQKTQNDEKRAFNFRLSRPRKTVECAFGMLAQKFRVFLGQMECSPEKATTIVKAACILHNFIRIHDGVVASPTYENDIVDAYNRWTSLEQAQPQGQNIKAKEYRNMLCEYFTRHENALATQNIYND